MLPLFQEDKISGGHGCPGIVNCAWRSEWNACSWAMEPMIKAMFSTRRSPSQHRHLDRAESSTRKETAY
jgi:hypothetical protein